MDISIRFSEYTSFWFSFLRLKGPECGSKTIPFQPLWVIQGRRRAPEGEPQGRCLSRDFISWIWVWRWLAQYFQSHLYQNKAEQPFLLLWVSEEMAGRTVLCSPGFDFGEALGLRPAAVGRSEAQGSALGSFPTLLSMVCSSSLFLRLVKSAPSNVLISSAAWGVNQDTPPQMVQLNLDGPTNTWLDSWDWDSLKGTEPEFPFLV